MGAKAKILILGTYNFENFGQHLINLEVGDITVDKKQDEIKEVVQKLSQFKPNKIAVELNNGKEKELNEVYSRYCQNNSYLYNETISYRSEIVQLGFRLGQMFNHSKIYPIDYPVDLPEELFEYVEKNLPQLYEKFMRIIKEYGIREKEFIKNNTVREILRHLNDPKRILNEHSNLYLHLAQVRSIDTYYGVDMLTQWYRRNLYILGNLQSIAESGDRILVIYGAGHCKVLQNLVRDYNKFELVDILKYL
ncbi:DUF5694 domain-containing protein [Clostridium bowmanii]|uniref:DUF5694 domain-containing protein n=1 Tax=Clostridium bowmanii TaxID=132925 RepID=UPI001C0E7375|nr:DUF5694 domain-containing protein [Clostridium bowmanii]MBU3190883.1 hypothetical protein [Clostridium bowmanii]MCA1075209.1 DUF5694 domain-containing protein [Clostridium bowmanii]